MKSLLRKAPVYALSVFTIFTGFVKGASAQITALVPDLPGPDTDLLTWVVTVLNWVIGLAALVAVAMIIAAGYMYITAGGDEGKVEKATKTLTNSIIGLILCFVAGMIVRFVLTNVLGQ
ncbi:MAG: pilin [Candidatus Dojkabacteria bacterium]|jgi:type IV secretory pathway VirB2 component (pilin)|nr:pilin [Candidatus Dojkabacteria bacterium]